MLVRTILRLETVLALTLAWGFVFLLPLRWARRLFGPPGRTAEQPETSLSLRRAQSVARRVDHVANRLPWHSSCLVRAMAGALLLLRRGIFGGIIRFGARKSDGNLKAHAWLLLEGTVLLGGAGAEDFTPLADMTFGQQY